MFKAIHLLVVISVFCVTAQAANSLVFLENFDGPDDVFQTGKWVRSSDAKYADQPILVKPPTKTIPDHENDRGVQLTQEMKHYGFGAKFDQPFDNSADEIVVQYELKLEEMLQCGGAYIKLLRENGESLDKLNNETPYSIMFGPDKCGSDSRVHFILKHQNPVTKEWTEHHYNGKLKPKLDRSYHLYSLVIRKDNSFDVYIDTKSVAHGSLLSDLEPPINPTAEIDDPADFKPSSWVDNEFMVDTTAVKPADWDETQPKKVPSNKAKPTTWDDTVPTTIVDPEAAKPADWDDEEDGEWEAPQVANPACETSGCGPWVAPLVSNPLYKGKWQPPRIPNPDYKGLWTARKIKNEAFFSQPNPYSAIAPMTALAVEVWTISAGILFDNFYVGHSYAEALQYALATTAPKAKAEKEALKVTEKERARLQRLDLLEHGNVREKVTVVAEMGAEYLKENPMVTIYAALAVVATLIYFLIFGWDKAGEPGRKSTTKKKEVVGKKSEPTKPPLESISSAAEDAIE